MKVHPHKIQLGFLIVIHVIKVIFFKLLKY